MEMDAFTLLISSATVPFDTMLAQVEPEYFTIRYILNSEIFSKKILLVLFVENDIITWEKEFYYVAN